MAKFEITQFFYVAGTLLEPCLYEHTWEDRSRNMTRCLTTSLTCLSATNVKPAGVHFTTTTKHAFNSRADDNTMRHCLNVVRRRHSRGYDTLDLIKTSPMMMPNIQQLTKKNPSDASQSPGRKVLLPRNSSS